jgi:hypothetical protein
VSLERPEPTEVELMAERTTVVTALPLKRAARERLTALLDARVVDVREPVDRADVVLTPAGSPQLMGMLRRTYPGARIVVVELDDWDFGVTMPGPVKRILQGGADAYLLADSLDELAGKLLPRGERAPAGEQEPVAPRELPASATVEELVTAFLRESIEYSTRVRAEERRG